MSGGLSKLESFVVGGYAFDWARRKSFRYEFVVRLLEIFDHQIKAGVAGFDVGFGNQNQMCAAAQLENSDLFLVHDGTHPELTHELRGLFELIGLEDDMSDPDRWSRILFAHVQPFRLRYRDS